MPSAVGPSSGLERIVSMRREQNAILANTAVGYIAGVDTLPWQAQQQNFARSKNAAANRPAPPFPVGDYLAMKDKFHAERFLHANIFGAIPLQ